MISNSSKSDAVVVIGGGFGGLTAALSLSSRKERPPIILIEPRPRFVFLPLLYELLSGELQSWEVAPLYRDLLVSKGIVLIEDWVEQIDGEKQFVVLSSGELINYAQLVISTGSKPSSFGVAGVYNHSSMFNKYEDVGILRKLISKLQNSNQPKQNLVIVGAGPTGVELSCKLADLLDKRTSIHIIDLSARILPNSKSFNQEQMEIALRERSIDLHLNTRVLKITESVLEMIKADNETSEPFSLYHSGVIWTAGVKPCLPEGFKISLSKDGRILIDSKLKVIGYSNVFAIGDVALDMDNCFLPTAQLAMQQGEHIAKNLILFRQGRHMNSFEFVDRGEMLSMGMGQATITGLGLTISGSIAFQMRRMMYLSKIPNFSLSIRSAGSWLLSQGKNLL